ncbi:MAG: flagellar M-ring protein FliF [Alphaproteobacteria bacterium]|nr:flagellar M-ring protein FliF [Alphaproteobacteria bacterium]
MAKLLESLKNMSTQQLAVFGGGSALLVIGIIASFLLLGGERYSLLYGNLSPEDSSEIVRVLEGLGEAYEIGNNGSILVAPQNVARLRINLAERNLPNSGTLAGYELFDEDQGFGTSNFVQEITHLRALEGELGRTIASIDGISKARVHLVLPKRELFSRNQRKPSASVVLDLSRNRPPKEKIDAVRSLVASAVPELQIGNISVIDSQGQLLARGDDGAQDNYLLSGNSPDELRAAYEARLAQELQDLVESVVGFGNARVEVRAEMDFSQTVIDEEIYDPDGQVLKSSQEINENSENTDNRNQGRITVENNLPGGNEPQEDGGSTIRSLSSRSEVINNYEISKQKVLRTIHPGQVERLSVAVLVDGTYIGEEADRLYEPRSPEELEQIQRLVRSAIGYDGTVRQDTVEVVNLQFAQEELFNLVTDDKILGVEVRRIERIVELVILSIVALVIFLLVLRPLVLRALANNAKRDIQILADGTMVDKKTGETVGPPPAGAAAVGAFGVEAGIGSLLSSGGEQMIDLVNVDARIKHTLSKQLNDVVAEFPNETGNVIKSWLLEG